MSYYIEGYKLTEKKSELFLSLKEIKKIALNSIKENFIKEKKTKILNDEIYHYINQEKKENNTSKKNTFELLTIDDCCIYIFDIEKDYFLINNTSIINFENTMEHLEKYSLSTSTGIAETEDNNLTEEQKYEMVFNDWESFTKESYYINEHGLRFELFNEKEFNEIKKEVDDLKIETKDLEEFMNTEDYSNIIFNIIIRKKIKDDVSRDSSLCYFDLYDEYKYERKDEVLKSVNSVKVFLQSVLHQQ